MDYTTDDKIKTLNYIKEELIYHIEDSNGRKHYLEVIDSIIDMLNKKER